MCGEKVRIFNIAEGACSCEVSVSERVYDEILIHFAITQIGDRQAIPIAEKTLQKSHFHSHIS